MGISMSSTNEMMRLASTPSDTQMDRFLVHIRKGLKADLDAERQQFELEISSTVLAAMRANADAVASLASTNASLSSSFQIVNRDLNEVVHIIDSTSSTFLTHISTMSAEIRQLKSEVEALRNRPTFWQRLLRRGT